MTIDSITVTVLTAREGYTLTNGEVFSKLVYLGSNDSSENWHEIPDEEVPKEWGGGVNG